MSSPAPAATAAAVRPRHAVVVLAKRELRSELTAFQRDAQRRAQHRALPGGCIASAHSQVVPSAYRRGEPRYDTLDEYHFVELADARAWASELALASGGAPAEVLLTDVVEVVGGVGVGSGLKHVELLRRRASMTRGDFLAYWRERHGPLAAAIPDVRRYLQLPTTTDPDAGDPPGSFDGLAILWFDSLESMREGAQHPAVRATREDMPKLVNEDRSVALLVQEVWRRDAPASTPTVHTLARGGDPCTG